MPHAASCSRTRETSNPLAIMPTRDLLGIFYFHILKKWLRGDFLEYRAICAQKYRHALRENEALCCFCQNGGVEIHSINSMPNCGVRRCWIAEKRPEINSP